MFNIKAKSWLTLYFITFFFIWGVFLPFWGVWLKDKGVSSEDIGIIFSVGLLLRFLSNLSILPRITTAVTTMRSIRVLVFLSTIAFAILFYLHDQIWLCSITLLVNFIMTPLMPLGDIVGSRLVSQIGLDYGKIRLWGSLSFIAGSTLVGLLIAKFGTISILYTIVFMLSLMWILSLCNLTPALKDSKQPMDQASKNLFAILKNKNVIIFFLIISLIQGSHAACYAFSSIYWTSAGISEINIAWLWGIGVFAEVVLMRFNSRLFTNWSIKQMFVLAACAGIFRWVMFATTDNFYLLAFAQTMHAFTFATTHLATMRYISSKSTHDMVKYQTLYSGVALGLFMALFTYISGGLYSSMQGEVFFIMAAILLPVFYLVKLWQEEQ